MTCVVHPRCVAINPACMMSECAPVGPSNRNTQNLPLFRRNLTLFRREGELLPRIIHMEDVCTRKPSMFVLDEVTGHYSSGKLELWSLAPDKPVPPEVGDYLLLILCRIVEELLEDV